VFLLGWLRLSGAAELTPYAGFEDSPPLVLEDLGGQQHALSELRGRVVLVNFWATWCSPCLIEMPGMQRLMTALQDRPFAILAVNVKEARNRVWRFKNMLNIQFTTLLDHDGSVAENWEVQVYPTSYLVGPEGRIRYVAYGALDWDSAATRKVIEALLPVPEAGTHGTALVLP
jgi:thiol-disulfide isomerase/thioredoxin